MTRDEMVELLVKARNILHEKQEVKEIDITLAHDMIDMVIDDLVITKN